MLPLEAENQQVLNLMQALLGAVSPNFRAVSIDCQDTVVLCVLLGEDNAEDREEIEDIEFEFLALQSRPVSVSTKILVSNRPIEEISLAGRLVFLRREPAGVSR